MVAISYFCEIAKWWPIFQEQYSLGGLIFYLETALVAGGSDTDDPGSALKRQHS